jgi:chemotaxis protein MotB
VSGRSAVRHFDEREEGASGERWLLTYADMITLLLALFIVLFALSTIDKKKYEEFKTGVVQAFSPHSEPIPGGTGLLQQTSLVTHPGTTKATIPNPLVNLQQRIQAALAQAGVSQDATVTVEQRGVVVRLLTDKVFFATYSADLGPVGDRVVDVVGQVASTLTNPVQVEGYTDNQPITGSGPYRTNFELSAARAMTVVDRLAGSDGVVPGRLSGIGYGDTRPIVPNDVLLGSSPPAGGG